MIYEHGIHRIPISHGWPQICDYLDRLASGEGWELVSVVTGRESVGSKLDVNPPPPEPVLLLFLRRPVTCAPCASPTAEPLEQIVRNLLRNPPQGAKP